MYFLSINRKLEGVTEDDIHKVIKEHIEWTRAAIKEGWMLQAGKWGDVGGMAMVKAEGLDEAISFLNQDPLVTNSLVEYETHRLFPAVIPRR